MKDFVQDKKWPEKKVEMLIEKLLFLYLSI